MNERVQLLLALADDELILGWRNSEWTGIAPSLEEDVAFSSIAQNEIGHARALYELAARELGTDADALAFDRSLDEYRSAPLVELRRLEWARTIARHWLYETADAIRLEALRASDDPELAGIAAKIDREEVYHRIHAEMWVDRLLGSDEGAAAARRGARGALAVRARRARRRAAPRARAAGGGEARASDAGRRAGRARDARGGARRAARRDDDGAPLGAGGSAMVSSAPNGRPARSTGRLARARGDPRPGDPGDLDRRPRRGRRRPRRGRAGRGRLHADVHGLPRARHDARADGGRDPRARRRARRPRRPRRLLVDRPDQPRRTREAPRGRVSRRPRPAAPGSRRLSSSSAARSAAPGAAPPTRASTTSSARLRAGRCATATPAASRSSSSRRSDGDEPLRPRREPAAAARGLRPVLREPAARRGAPARGSGRRGAVRGVRAALRRRATRARAARERAPADPPHARPLRRADRRGRVPPRLARAPRARGRPRAPLGCGRPRRPRGPVHDARVRRGRRRVPALDDVRVRARPPRGGARSSRTSGRRCSGRRRTTPTSVLTSTRRARSAGWR